MIIYNIFCRQKIKVNYVELDRFFYNLKENSARYVYENKRKLTQNFALSYVYKSYKGACSAAPKHNFTYKYSF